MSTDRLWWVAPIVFAFGLVACGRWTPPEKAKEVWSIRVERILGEAPAGLERCALSGARCEPLEVGRPFRAPALVRSRGALATLTLGPDSSVELGEGASIELASEEQRRLTLLGGVALVERPAGVAGYELRTAGHVLGSDPDQVQELALFARDAVRATITVRRGELSVSGPEGAPVRIGRARTVRLVAGRPPDRRAAWAGLVAPVRRLFQPSEGSKPDGVRGVGRITARVPATREEVPGVRMIRHDVRVAIIDGYARTEVEEEFFNDTDRVLEGRYRYPLAAGASVSRLALWVGERLVEGEVVERKRASRIFQGIVDDSTRPRDPALLEWVSSGDLSLKIFPILPKQSRRVVLAYNQALSDEGGTVRYVYPLAGSTPLGDFRFSARIQHHGEPLGDVTTPHHAANIEQRGNRATVSFSERNATIRQDLVVSFRPQPSDHVRLSVSAPNPSGGPAERLSEVAPGANDGFYFALRVIPGPPSDLDLPVLQGLSRAIVIDRSESQAGGALSAEVELAAALLDDLGPDERFVLLACDSACEMHPAEGLAQVSRASLDAAREWLSNLSPGGASDPAGALVSASAALGGQRAGQVVVLGDGRPSAGQMDAASIVSRVWGALEKMPLDLRLIAVGRTVNHGLFRALSTGVGATVEELASEGSLASRIDEILLSLRTPVIEHPRLTLPAGLTDVVPRRLPNLRLGQALTVVGRMAGFEGGKIRIEGSLAGEPYRFVEPATLPASPNNPLVPRLWAERTISELSAEGSEAAERRIVSLSRRHQVLSPFTSLLVLEDDRMFAEFGIARSQRRAPPLLDPEGASGSFSPLLLDDAGDGPGTATVPAPSLGLSGLGTGGGGRLGFGAGSGRLGGSHRTSAPRVRMGQSAVSGRLPPEVIQRVVRQNFGRFRLCYEQGLARSPLLAGRVVVRFLIDRQGMVSTSQDGGSSLSDPGVVACVVQAMRGLAFPAPEGGVVTVTFPIALDPGLESTWAPAGAKPPRVLRAAFPIVHRRGSEAWRESGVAELERLRARVESHPESRRARTHWLQGLVRRGRFQDALRVAEELVRADPENPAAHQWLARAALLGGDRQRAARELSSAVELAEPDPEIQLRVARANEALGDEARACAHWRAAFELDPTHAGARFQALRCRALLGELGTAQAEALRVPEPDPALSTLKTLLEQGRSEAYHPAQDRRGWFQASVSCPVDARRCPIPVVITPTGAVVSPFTPERAAVGADRVELSFRTSGVYRTLLVGGEPEVEAEVRVVAAGVALKARAAGPGPTTVVETEVRPGGSGGG